MRRVLECVKIDWLPSSALRGRFRLRADHGAAHRLRSIVSVSKNELLMCLSVTNAVRAVRGEDFDAAVLDPSRLTLYLPAAIRHAPSRLGMMRGGIMMLSCR